MNLFACALFFILLHVNIVCAAELEIPLPSIDPLADGCRFKIDDLLQKQYDKTKPPTQKGKPAIVSISVLIIDIPAVKINQFVVDMDIVLHQRWFDDRIKIPANCQSSDVILDNKWKDEIWLPDIVFRNSRNGHLLNILIPYTYIVLSNSSQLFMASRLSLSLYCIMDLTKFPHDIQTCEIEITSLRHPAESMDLQWSYFNISKSTELPQFYVKKTENTTLRIRTIVANKIATLSILRGVLYLHRRQGYYLLNYFIPSILIVMTSFVTFWVPPTSFPSRVALTLTPLLTLVTQSYRGNNFPSVSYITAMTIWTSGCIIFVFCTLIEYAILIFLYQKDSKIKKNVTYCSPQGEGRVNSKRESEAFLRAEKIDETKVAVESKPKETSITKWRKWFLEIHVDSMDEYHNTLDVRSRILFPAFFAIFIIVYFAIFAKR